MLQRPGFSRDELKARYDIESITEDEWHSHCAQESREILREFLSVSKAPTKLLLNAGAGVHELKISGWLETSVDLFEAPLRTHQKAICASVENLPFGPGKFGAVVCIGEVLGYCDPARAIAEFSRVLASEGVLICDFGNSHSIRHWFTSASRRAAHLIVDTYNGTSERIWIYSPDYIKSILAGYGFGITRVIGTHIWSAAGRKVGMSPAAAVRWQTHIKWLPLAPSWADVTTIVAVRL